MSGGSALSRDRNRSKRRFDRFYRSEHYEPMVDVFLAIDQAVTELFFNFVIERRHQVIYLLGILRVQAA